MRSDHTTEKKNENKKKKTSKEHMNNNRAYKFLLHGTWVKSTCCPSWKDLKTNAEILPFF